MVDKKKLIAGGAVVFLALGGGVAFAAQQVQEEEEAPIVEGSVTAPEESGEANEAAEEAVEAREAESLRQLVGIDRFAAEEAALDAVPGEVREVELENENGFVVYEVEVAGQDGALHEVVVDAGNGKVVGQEVEEVAP